MALTLAMMPMPLNAIVVILEQMHAMFVYYIIFHFVVKMIKYDICIYDIKFIVSIIDFFYISTYKTKKLAFTRSVGP